MKPLFENAMPAKSSLPVQDVSPLNPLTPVAPVAPVALVAPAGAASLVPAAASAQTVRVTPPRVNEDQVALLGADAASALTGVSSELLKHVRTSDTGDFGKGLNQLVVMAKGLNPEALQSKGFLGKVLGTVSNAKERLVAQYASVESRIDTLTTELDGKAALHRKRIGDLEALYTNNFNYHQGLEASVHQCRELLAQMQADFAREQAKAVADSFDAQVLADYQRVIARIEKRIDDLQRAQLLSKQVAPQIRLMQEDARSLVNKFGDVKSVTLPAWKNTFSLYVLQLEQQQAVQVLNAVDATTDEALRKSADLLRQNTAQIAEARNRSVVSIDTVIHIQEQLIGAVKDVQRIDEEGARRRQAEAPKLLAMETELINTFAPGKR